MSEYWSWWHVREQEWVSIDHEGRVSTGLFSQSLFLYMYVGQQVIKVLHNYIASWNHHSTNRAPFICDQDHKWFVDWREGMQIREMWDRNTADSAPPLAKATSDKISSTTTDSVPSNSRSYMFQEIKSTTLSPDSMPRVRDQYYPWKDSTPANQSACYPVQLLSRVTIMIPPSSHLC